MLYHMLGVSRIFVSLALLSQSNMIPLASWYMAIHPVFPVNVAIRE